MKRSIYHRKLIATGNKGFLLSLPPEYMRFYAILSTTNITEKKNGCLEIYPGDHGRKYSVSSRYSHGGHRVYIPGAWVARHGLGKGSTVYAETLTTANRCILRVWPTEEKD